MTPESKAQTAHRKIRERIESGHYSPGYRLVLQAIADELGMSVAPVREALRMLEAEQLVNYQRNIGARVSMIRETEYLHTMQTLALVEAAATALAAPHLTRQDIRRAREINQQMRKTISDFDPARFTKLNEQFHEVLYEHCPNPHILDLVRRGWNRMRLLRISSFGFIPGRALESINEHEELLDLIETGAGSAAIELTARKHRLSTLEAVLTENKNKRKQEAA